MKPSALITGGAGFLGRHFADELLRRGWNVLSIDVTARWDSPSEGGQFIHVIENMLNVIRKIDETRFDLVVHCAAKDPHRAAIDAVNMNFSYNVALDAALFEWAVRTKQKRVLYISSSAVYPVSLQTDVFTSEALKEDVVDVNTTKFTIDVPDKLYGWTKYIGEMHAAVARRNGLAVHVIRPFSGYGETQSENFPFRAFVERARRRENPFMIWGSARQVRDFIHVSDVVRGALAVVEADEQRPVNLCTGVATSMRDLAFMCMTEVGYAPEITVNENAPLGVMYRVGDPTRMLSYYEPKVTIEEGVARALAGERLKG